MRLWLDLHSRSKCLIPLMLPWRILKLCHLRAKKKKRKWVSLEPCSVNLACLRSGETASPVLEPNGKVCGGTSRWEPLPLLDREAPPRSSLWVLGRWCKATQGIRLSVWYSADPEIISKMHKLEMPKATLTNFKYCISWYFGLHANVRCAPITRQVHQLMHRCQTQSTGATTRRWVIRSDFMFLAKYKIANPNFGPLRETKITMRPVTTISLTPLI